MADSEANSYNTRGTWRRYLPLVVLAAVMALVFGMGWHKYISLEKVLSHREALQAAVNENRYLAVLAYVALYAAVVALSLPVALLLTLTGGLLFGWFVGGLASVAGATIGATAIFLIARTSLGEPLARRAGPKLAKVRAGFEANAMSYLLLLRLVPVLPFWLVNLAPALLGVPLKTYVIATFIGIIPATFAYASAGASIDSVVAKAQAKYDACVAAKGPGFANSRFRSGTSLRWSLELRLLSCVSSR